MKEKPNIKNMFSDLNKKHFEGRIKEIPVLWNNRMRTTAGRCTYTRKRIGSVVNYMPIKIELSEKLFENNNYDLDKVERTLIHEMVHAFLVQEYNERGHTARFHRIMTNITGENKNHRCHSYNTDGLKNKARYEAICPIHGSVGKRNRRPRINTKYSCTMCGSIVRFVDIQDNNNFWSIK